MAAEIAISFAPGSSPLTRGKPDRRTCAPRQPRLIPAHAGKTRWAPCERSGCAAHPRSRGENLDSANPHFRTRGSSPLTRGKHSSQVQYQRQGGLIPAHAGKTTSPSTGSDTRSAHPRSRGENARGRETKGQTTGSSPLTRGKLVEAFLSREGQRLIPAHAGKTKRRPCRTARSTAHPRSRGENEAHRRTEISSAGSSPLTRGKPYVKSRLSHGPRLIPAHAGKTQKTL